jgi:uncharacterized protein (TIGR03435 family)
MGTQARFPLRICLSALFAPLLCCISAATAQAPTSAQSPPAKFEIASVKPSPPNADPRTGLWSSPGVGRFFARHVPLTILIQLAYGIDPSQIANKPGWMDTNLYDVDAKPEEGVSLTREELKPCLQDLLQERFHLVAHMETRFGQGYALVVAQNGPHLTPAAEGHFPGQRHPVSSGHLHVYNCSIAQLAQYLTSAASFPVADGTGLAGSYDIDFDYNSRPDRESSLQPLDVALKETTGLLLKPQKVPVDTLVIDSADKVPTEN